MKIAILGSAPSSLDLAPFKDASYQQYAGGKVQLQPPTPHIDEEWFIWACSPGCYGRVARCDVYFELHRFEPGQPWFSPEYVKFLQDFKGPVYTGGVIPEFPAHIVYPIAEVEKEFSTYFLTSSISLMIALAIMKCEEFDRKMKEAGHETEQHTIGLWGVDMAATEEWATQRPGCQHFILEALRRGIQIYVPPESDLLRPMPVYGLCEWEHAWIKSLARLNELKQRQSMHEASAKNAENSSYFMKGAIENQRYNMDTWTSTYGLPSGQVLRKVEESQEPDRYEIDTPSQPLIDTNQRTKTWQQVYKDNALISDPECNVIQESIDANPALTEKLAQIAPRVKRAYNKKKGSEKLKKKAREENDEPLRKV